MTWIFVLGKNPELSLMEISAYFGNRGVGVEFVDSSDRVVVAEVELEPEKVQFDLGGTIKIAEVVGEVSYKDFKRAFGRGSGEGREKIGETLPEAGAASIYEYGERDLEELNFGNFKKFLGEFGMRTKKGGNEFTHVEVNKMGLVGEELIVGICRDTVYFGVTRAVTEPFDYQKRDTGRPRPMLLGISPSRAGILVNLAGVEGQRLLDPFCGGGTIGQEALLRGLFVRLSDINGKHVEFCRQNLEWLKKYGKKVGREVVFDGRELRKEDARKLDGFEVDCIATEPYLGPGFRERPEMAEGEKVIGEIDKLYREFLSTAWKVLKGGGKVGLICPVINTRGGPLRLDIEDIAKRCGFKLRAGPVVDSEREKGRSRIVAREFVVLEKVIK